MSFTWYGNQHESQTIRFGALAVIFPLLERMNVMQIINRHLPADPQLEFDYGSTLSLLMAARLYSPMALSNVAEWATDSGADILWNMPPEKINDDRLGRALDAFFEQRHSILASLALKVAHEFDVPLKELHYDPTHLLFEGAYEKAEPRGNNAIERNDNEETIHSDAELDPAHVAKGRATDDAPKGSLMVHAGLSTHVDEFGPLPIFGHVVDGNQNGRTAIDEQLALFRKHLRLKELTMISDRGTFSVGHLLRLKDEGFHAICSVPWGEFRALFDKHFNSLAWREANYLSVEQQRRRNTKSELPQEHYEIAVLRHRLKDEDSKKEIACRVIFVFSTADKKVVQKQRQKQINRIREELEKAKKNVARRGPFSDEAAVSRRMNRLLSNRDAAKYFSWKMVALNKREQKRLRTSDRGSRFPTHRFEYTFDQAAVLADEEYDGYSALVSTVPQNKHSADELFTKFKQQTYSELVNRNFKGPLAVRPVFVHTPQRVEALVFLMIAVLMLYYLLQRHYRQTVPEDAPPKEKRTTTRTILNAFSSYALLIHNTRFGREVQPTRPTRRQREILNQLGFPTPAQILSKRLPRPPT